MVLSTDTMDNEEGYDSKPPAFLDIDGVVNQGIPLGIRFSQYLDEQSYEENTGREIDISFGKDGIEVRDNEGENYAWEEVRDDLKGKSDFDPDSLEEIYGIWSSLQQDTGETSPYSESVEEITGHWMMGIVGRQKEDIERRGEEFIEDISVDIPRPFNNIIGMLQRDYKVIPATTNPQEITEPLADIMGVEESYGTMVADRDGKYVPSFERNMGEGKDAILTDIPYYDHPQALVIGDMPTEYPLYANIQNVFHITGDDEEITEEQLRAEIEEYAQTEENSLPNISNFVKRISGNKPEKNVFLLEDFDTLGSALQSDKTNEIHEALGIN